MTFEQRIETCRTIIDDLSLPTVRDWKTKHPGKNVVGMFPVYLPYEIPHAAGMLPVGLLGGGGRIEIDHADSRIQSFVCSIARSTLELGLRKMLDECDALWFPSICDVARNLSGVWRSNFPNQLVEYVHFPQNVVSPAAQVYYRTELQNLLHRLELLGGMSVTGEALANSIRAYNKNRALCSRVYAVRREQPWLLSTYETYILIRMGTLIPVEEHSALLEEMLSLLEGRKREPRDHVRVMLEGSFCEQPPLELLQVIEEAGCYIVDDDLLLHSRWFTDEVRSDGDPLGALAEHYLNRSTYSSVRHYGNRSRKEQFVERIRRGNVDGVVFCAPKFCEPALLDYVVLKDEAEKQGIAYLTFEYEEKMGTFESVRIQAETFVESLMFFS